MLTSVSPLPLYLNTDLVIYGLIPPGSTSETDNAIIGSIYMEGDIKWLKTQDGYGNTKWSKESSLVVSRASKQLGYDINVSYLRDTNLIYGYPLDTKVKELKPIASPITPFVYINDLVSAKTYVITTDKFYNGVHTLLEGSTIVITVNTTGIADGDKLMFNIIGADRDYFLYNSNLNRITPSEGHIIINNNTGSITLTSGYTALTQRYNDSFLFMLNGGAYITIAVFDTTPVYECTYSFLNRSLVYTGELNPNPSGSPYIFSTWVYSNETLDIKFVTENIVDGTSLNYELKGLNPEEVSSPLNSHIIITNNIGYLSLQFNSIFIPTNTKLFSIDLKVPESYRALILRLVNPVTHTLTSSAINNSDEEGTTFLIELATTNVQNGFKNVGMPSSQIPYTITGVNAEDINKPLNGYLTIVDNHASINIATIKDYLTEGTETLVFSTSLTSIEVSILDTSTTQLNNIEPDPYFNNVKLLIQSNGTSGNQGIVDYSFSNRVMYNSNVLCRDTTRGVMPTSLEFKYSQPIMLTTLKDIVISNTNNFTIEFRVFITGENTTNYLSGGLLLALYNSSIPTYNNTNSLIIYASSQGDNVYLDVIFNFGSEIWLNAADIDPPLQFNTWISVAITKENDISSLYINGNFVASETVLVTPTTIKHMVIGGSLDSEVFNGWLDNIRISDSNRYITDYTPSITNFPVKPLTKPSYLITDIISLVNTETPSTTSAKLQLNLSDYIQPDAIIGVEVGPTPTGEYIRVSIISDTYMAAPDIIDLFNAEFLTHTDLITQGWTLSYPRANSYGTITSPIGLANVIIRAIINKPYRSNMSVTILTEGKPALSNKVIEFRIETLPYAYAIGEVISLTLATYTYTHTVVDTNPNEIASSIATLINDGGYFTATVTLARDYYSEGIFRTGGSSIRVTSISPSNDFSYSSLIV